MSTPRAPTKKRKAQTQMQTSRSNLEDVLSQRFLDPIFEEVVDPSNKVKEAPGAPRKPSRPHRSRQEIEEAYAGGDDGALKKLEYPEDVVVDLGNGVMHSKL
jgi:hypothetical protein